MMKRASRHIHALIVSWLTGNTTPEEILRLNRLITATPAINIILLQSASRVHGGAIETALIVAENIRLQSSNHEDFQLFR